MGCKCGKPKSANKPNKNPSPAESDCQIPSENLPSYLKNFSEFNKNLSPMLYKPMDQKHNCSRYVEALRPYLIGSFNMKKSNSNEFEHFYNNLLKNKSSSPSVVKSKRINTEIKMLSKNLPLNYTNSIFLKYDESRMDLMKSLIIGSDDTPYANGVFLYDIFLDDTYPSSPPKMNLITTGNNTIRFNPNLYTNGYICLSLLGTWSGDNIEKWNSQTSNILQILLSIQSIVMSDGVYFNEPGYATDKNSQTNKALNLGYSNIVRYATVKFAMNEQIKKIPRGFEEIVRTHFVFKKEDILKTCYKWLEESKDDAMAPDYGGLVSSHNNFLASKFKSDKHSYTNMLYEEIKELEKNFIKIENKEI